MQCICNTLFYIEQSPTLEEVVGYLGPLCKPSNGNPISIFLGPNEMAPGTHDSTQRSPIQYIVGGCTLKFPKYLTHVYDAHANKRENAMVEIPNTNTTQSNHSMIFEQATKGLKVYEKVPESEARNMRSTANRNQNLLTSLHRGQAYRVKNAGLEKLDPCQKCSSLYKDFGETGYPLRLVLVMLCLVWMIVLRICGEWRLWVVWRLCRATWMGNKGCVRGLFKEKATGRNINCGTVQLALEIGILSKHGWWSLVQVYPRQIIKGNN